MVNSFLSVNKTTIDNASSTIISGILYDKQLNFIKNIEFNKSRLSKRQGVLRWI